MHSLSSAFVLGYHGCDDAAAEHVLAGHTFIPSQNEYDWLGHGIYFWEANPRRGFEFAQESMARRGRAPRIRNPTVVGAVIDLGLCLDLTTSAGISKVRTAHQVLLEIVKTTTAGKLPQNNKDGLRRALDCATINTLHDIIAESGESPVDSVKGVFIEGSPIYPGSSFYQKSHTQICVRNPDCIKGVFRVPAIDLT